MKNKICVVTGATSGIGAETAQALAQSGATVIIVGRNKRKCTATVKKIKQVTGNPYIDFMVADLSSLSQVRQLALQLSQKYKCLDVLVNNAGVYLLKRKQTADGFEMTFAVNYLSMFLLTNLLIEMLKESAQGRVINVSSSAHEKGMINFSDLQLINNFNGFNAYAQSKLAIVLFTYELARRLKHTNITVNVLHPGLVASNFGKNNGLLRFYVRKLIKRDDVSVPEGAQTSIYLATSPEVENITGKYFIKKKQVQSIPPAYDEVASSRLWQVSEELTGIIRE